MSSSRRRGRSPGAPANSKPPTLTAPQSEVADALLAEASADKGQAVEQEPEQGPETDAMEVPAVEAAVEQPALEVAAKTSEPSADPAPAETQAAEGDLSVERPAQEALGAVAAVAEEASLAPPAPEQIVSETAETVETAAEATDETLARTLAETALLPGLAETKPSDNLQPKPHSVHIGASFAFVPTIAPLTEINARLFAFARGEGEAAIAHIQALARAKSPAEAIRLQVTEMQRAADASLTCFSEIVRSANRFGDTARRH
ncbi:phasin family protein [Methylobacterium sp. R2-1]|uniref:phasin family protein n=1 Tax=Methylobacterium sp. R2-1 TaxID=2587064 RepID=UPI001610D727|nr:phasin family protein [Methylobacterium sp. R2-1]MBB2963692.1 hypothetical protein [Methylobacterium sp. R2-1]